MLQLALATLLAGSLLAGGPDGDKDPTKTPAQAPIESIIVDNSSDELGEDDPINDTYALGRTERIPIKLWVGYSQGSDSEIYLPDGEEADLDFLGFTEARARRAFVGAQINVINFTNFSVGAGGQLITGQNESDLRDDLGGGTLDSGFGLQNAKVYGIIRGRTLGVHGGFIFDLGDDTPAGELALEGERPSTDQVDAWFVGANFDYPSERFRLFGGIDYFNRDDAASVFGDVSEPSPGSAIEDDELVVFNAGAGLRISWVEIGAAALMRTNLSLNRFFPSFNTGGGHHGSIAPYLILSPPALPVAISVKGAVLSEYADYGYSLGGASDFVTHRGFTVTASLGF